MEPEEKNKLIIAGKWAGAIAAILGLIVMIIGGIVKINTLVSSIQASSVSIQEMKSENANNAKKSREDLDRVIGAIQSRAEQDREIITQLRIAVASLSAVAARSNHPSSIRMTSGPVLTSMPSDLGGAQIAIDRAEALSNAHDPLSGL